MTAVVAYAMLTRSDADSQALVQTLKGPVLTLGGAIGAAVNGGTQSPAIFMVLPSTTDPSDATLSGALGAAGVQGTTPVFAAGDGDSLLDVLYKWQVVTAGALLVALTTVSNLLAKQLGPNQMNAQLGGTGA